MTLRRLRLDALIVVLAVAGAYLASAPSPADQPTARFDVSASASAVQPSGAPRTRRQQPAPAGRTAAITSGAPSPSGAPRHVAPPSGTGPVVVASATSGGPRAGAPQLQTGAVAIASWYRDPRRSGFYAAMPAYRWGMATWSVRVCSAAACVAVRVVDHCQCHVGTRNARAIDLSPSAFARLSPLGRGLVRVTIRRLS